MMSRIKNKIYRLINRGDSSKNPYVHPDKAPPDYICPPQYTKKFMKHYISSKKYKQKQTLLDEKIKKLYNYGHDQEIKKKVIPEVRAMGVLDYSQVHDSFKTATITSEVLGKGNYISRKIGDIAGRSLEIYLYSLDNLHSRGKPVTRDLYIAQEQNVWPARCSVSAYGVLLSKLEIRDKLKKRIIGWSHSHAALTPFFSGGEDGDIENTVNILQSHGLEKCIRVFDNTYSGKGYKGVEYKVRYTPAIVFNAANSKPFVAIAVEYTKLFDRQKVFNVNENAQLEVIEETNGIDMEKASIDKQILERVLVDSTPLLDIYRRRMGTSKKDLYNVIRI